MHGSGEKLNDRIYVWCPGCDLLDPGHSGLHSFSIVTEGSTEQGPTWSWNGSLESPGFEPSYMTWRGGNDPALADHRCHSHLRNGVWEFLGDCTHALANQHVPLPPLPDWVARP